jgi:hypothetical protein
MGTTTNVVDYLKYSIVNNDRSYGAYPDGAPAKRRVFYYATPYAPNNNSWPAVPVLVNEWMADNSHTIVNRAEGKWSDWFELYNSGPSTVDLSGYYLGTTLTSSNQFEIPAGYTIPSGGFLLVWADSTSGNNSASDPALHTNFKLSANGESIALFTPAGALIEGVTFGLQTNDISQGRFPDGNSGQYYFMTNATPGAPNMLAQAVNHAPVLTAVPDQSVYQGSPLTFTASAMDVDLGQTLTYSLDPGSPGTAFINPSSGVFTWTPTQADPPGIYFAYLRVTDNGLPQGNDTGTARITVLTPPPLTITSIDLGEAGGLTITWATQPQRTYRVLYKTNLDQPTWSTLTELTAAGTQLWTADDTGGASRRFYRIELLPY